MNSGFHVAFFGTGFVVFGIGVLMMAWLSGRPWYFRYVAVALGALFILLGVLIPLSMRSNDYAW